MTAPFAYANPGERRNQSIAAAALKAVAPDWRNERSRFPFAAKSVTPTEAMTFLSRSSARPAATSHRQPAASAPGRTPGYLPETTPALPTTAGPAAFSRGEV